MGEYASDDWPAQPPMSALLDSVSHADLFELCAAMPDASVDMILCDLPYAVTAATWDVLIPFEPMWMAFKRIVKPRAAVVLTASQPFTSLLVCSNLKMFRYEWIWEKTMATGFLNTPHMPLKAHESALVFGGTSYTPQFTVGKAYTAKTGKGERDTIRDKNIGGAVTINSGYRHPRSVLRFDNETGLHPTQKPVDLFRYLIRTYTQPNELVFDPCVGSGTTAISAREEGRRFVCGDSSAEYVAVARNRLATPYTPSFMPMLEAS